MGATFFTLQRPSTELRRPHQVRAMKAITREASDRFASASRSYLPSILECNAALVRLALVDTGIAFACVRKLSTATSTWQFDEVMTRHARQHFDAVSETAAQLSTLLEKGLSKGDENMSLTFWD